MYSISPKLQPRYTEASSVVVVNYFYLVFKPKDAKVEIKQQAEPEQGTRQGGDCRPSSGQETLCGRKLGEGADLPVEGTVPVAAIWHPASLPGLICRWPACHLQTGMQLRESVLSASIYGAPTVCQAWCRRTLEPREKLAHPSTVSLAPWNNNRFPS